MRQGRAKGDAVLSCEDLSAAHIVQVGSSMTMRSRIDLMMHSSQGDIEYLLRGIFIQYRKSRKE